MSTQSAACDGARALAAWTNVEREVMHEPGRFYVVCDGETAELLYERRDDVLDVHHTWTPPRLRGRELAAVLTDAVFAYARAEGLRIRPTCSYTRTYVDRHAHLRALCAGA